MFLTCGDRKICPILATKIKGTDLFRNWQLLGEKLSFVITVAEIILVSLKGRKI
jgi:hypothetical protein